jgi:hypothetical protein
MSKKTGNRKSPLERKATQHHDFIGEAAPERAQAEAVKKERLAAERKQDVVQEMAQEFEEVAARSELRVPRSIKESKRLLKESKRLLSEGPELLREKAKERLDALPQPAHKLLELASTAISIAFAPARLGLRLLMNAVEIPVAVFHSLRRKEA